ncbi:MAG: hypothetical protein M3Z66_12585, partial [Chloroflexota bacterium]|nr:hypothetical protein [Chloroflexota bacterium]
LPTHLTMTQLPSGTAGNVAGGERLPLSCLNTSSGVLARSLVGGIGPQADTMVPCHDGAGTRN